VSKHRPYKFQKVGVRKIQQFGGRALLADEMGLGKSFQCLLWAWTYLDQEDSVVIVCPKTIRENWKREAAFHLDLRAEVLEKRTPAVTDLRPGIYVVNYDILGTEHSVHRTWVQILKRLKPKLVVVDECHYISSPGIKRTAAVRALCRTVPHVVCVSGTPLTNNPMEMFVTLNLLRPKLFPSYPSFVNRYCRLEVPPWGRPRYIGPRNLKSLHRKLRRTVMIRRRKVDVLDQLPPKTRTVVPVDIDGKEYKKAEQDFAKWLRETHPHKAGAARKAERLVKFGYLLRLAADLKMPAVKDWIDGFLKESDGKLITFGVHKKVVKGLDDHYKRLSTRVDGSVTGHKRQTAIDSFLNRDDVRLFFGNIKAAGVGWSARGVSTVLFAEMGWTPGEHVQAEDRVHGIGRGKEGTVSNVYYLVARGTLEEDLCKLLQKKQKTLDGVLDGRPTDEGLSIYDQLEEAFLQRTKAKIRGKK
jgi:SWI/SNF-related matrix-associated actin-dependent regulator 1 of chromatin subfamily A